jgi:hypothetical protein
MLVEDLSALAALAGQAVVTAAVTDAWGTAKRGFARLLGRGDQDRTKVVERRLEEARNQLAGSEGADLERTRAVLAAQWSTRVADLLEDYPDAEADLRALIEQIQAALPAGMVSAADHGIAAGRDVQVKDVKADRGGFAAGIVSGDVTLPGPTGPGPETT